MSPDPVNVVRLVVGDQEFAGWKSVRIEAGIERQARSFSLEVTDRWPGSTDLARKISAGNAVQVAIGTDLVVNGYVDATPIRYDGNSYTINVRGRSKTADLVDCCPVQSGKIAAPVGAGWSDVIGLAGKVTGKVIKPPSQAASQWRNMKLERIAAALAAPYGVRVLAEVDTGKAIAEHHIQPGETVFESINRMMLLRHVLSTDNERGDLVFIEPGSRGRATTMLELGRNILSGAADLDYTGVFSEYICNSQRSGNDEEFGDAVSEESARTTDARATRRRVLVIHQSGNADAGTCRDRVEYEKAHRAAKCLETTYSVIGWRQADGSLWQPNMEVQIKDALIGFDTRMLIAECAWILDRDGMRTELRVGPIDGYRTRAGKLKDSKDGKGGGDAWSDVK